MRNRLTRLGLLIMLWLAGCSPIAIPDRSIPLSATDEGSSSFAYRFKWVKCATVDLPLEIDCGYFVVPVNHADPQSGKIRLAVTILRASAKEKAADPVVFLAGGPGASATYSLADWIDQPFLRKRDLILVDLRGSGNSEPSLNCPEIEQDRYADPVRAAQTCYQRLKQAGLDLSQFNNLQAAADLEALRGALGIKRWNLLGISSGARLALVMMRNYPESIRSAILDSTAPPQVNAYETRPANGAQALQTLFQSCQADSRCNYAYPDLEGLFYELLGELDQKPAAVQVANPFDGATHTVQLDGRVLANLVFEALYRKETLARIPYVIYEAHYGRYPAIGGLMFPRTQALFYPPSQADARKGAAESEGAYFSFECNEEVPFNRVEAARRSAGNSIFAQHLLTEVENVFEVCNSWNSGLAAAQENEAVQSPIPTLILNGQYDPITPAAWGQAAAQDLQNSYVYSFPGLGHAVLENDKCPRDIAAAFLSAPAQEPDASCINRMKLDFWLP